MNQLGRETLRAAAVKGVRQIQGKFSDGAEGFCALGVLAWCARDDVTIYDLGHQVSVCPLCGEARGLGCTEEGLVIHFNDDHHLDFLGIAEKMPVSEEHTDGV